MAGGAGGMVGSLGGGMGGLSGMVGGIGGGNMNMGGMGGAGGMQGGGMMGAGMMHMQVTHSRFCCSVLQFTLWALHKYDAHADNSRSRFVTDSRLFSPALSRARVLSLSRPRVLSHTRCAFAAIFVQCVAICYSGAWSD